MAWAEYLHNYMQQQERADLWHVLGERFMRFAGEEQGRAEPTTKGEVLRRMDQVLRASCTYRKHPEGWERGKPEQGMICLLDTPPHGVWNYCSDGISENFFERVRLCVAQAGRALPDCPKDTDPEDFWLHRLYLNLLENNSDSLFCASKEGGMIVGVCVASATFCARLRRHALVHAQEDAKSSIVVSLEERENLAEAGAAAFQQEVKAARLSLALGRPLTLRTGANHPEPSPPENRAKSPQYRVQNNSKETQTVEGRSVNQPGRPASWQEIGITFLSDERVEICNGSKNRETRNYAEFGFEDRRNGKPNLAWVTLRELAKKGSEVPRTQPGVGRAAFQKRIEEIREKLRAHFGIDADPIPFNGDSYRVSFKLACRPSFES